MGNNTIKKVAAMYGTSFLGILLGFAVSIFNSRVLGPDSFGDFKFVETVARFISSLVSVGFFLSLTRLIAINKENHERQYVGLYAVIFLIISLLGTLLFLFFSYIEPLFFNHQLGSTIRNHFFIVIAIVGHLSLTEILKGLHKIYTLALLGILPMLIYLVLAYYFDSFIAIDLSFVLLLYYGILLLIDIVLIISLKPDFKFKKILVTRLFEENKTNGRPIYFGSLAGVATTHIAGLSISYFMENRLVGFYMLALTVCSPLLIIPSVLGTTFFKQFANMEKIPKKLFFWSLIVTGVALVIFYCFVEQVIITFYSEAFAPVAKIAKLLILGFIFHGTGDLINRFLGAKGKGKLLRNAAFMVGLVNVLGYTLLIKFWDINGAIITKIFASGLYLLIMVYYYNNFIKKTNYV